MRNIFSFYFGWQFLSSFIVLGIDMVFWLGLSKKNHLIIFWIIAPILILGFGAFAAVKEGKFGILSSIAFWLSVTWAALGAAV